MKKTISLFLALVLLMSVFSLVFADEIGEQYYTVKVEYSDNVGKKEQLNLMVQGYNVYVDAKMLAERFGYTFGENGNCAVIFNKDMSNGLPVSISEFEYNSTRVSHMLFNRMVDTYKAPFASVKNDKGSWIPLEYSLLLLNSGMAISERALLIDMPTKRVVDYFYDIAKNAERYNFDWTKDFGYKNSDITILAGSSHLVNLFNGLLGYDGTSWASLFQQFLVSTSAYDKKYGEDIALLICTESQEELEAAAEKMEFMSSLLNEDGELGELLSNISYMDDFEVGQMYRQCEAALEGFKAGNTTLATYNRSYEALEKALDKQTWFSHTGGYILEVQKGASNAIGEVLDVCDVAVKIAEIVGYVNEFQNQDEFSLTALKRYLDTQDNSTELPNAMKKSMMDYSDALSSNIMGYTVKRFWDNIDQWIADGVTDKVPLFSIIGKQGTGVLLAWNIASNTIPFISDGISAADKFELALYAQVLQGDTFRSYLNKRNSVFSEDASLTAGNVYDAAQLCYIYLKSCMVTRDAAIASLENKKSELGEEIQPLIDVQNEINGEIANILAAFKEANSTNIDGSLGFLPSDNENYLNIYDDSKLVLWITEVKNANENSDSVDLTDGYWERMIQSHKAYQFLEDGTVDVYDLNPGEDVVPENLVYSTTYAYQWDGSTLILDYGDGYTTELKPVTKSSEVDWDTGLTNQISQIPDGETFFYETNFDRDAHPLGNAMYLSKAHVSSKEQVSNETPVPTGEISGTPEECYKAFIEARGYEKDWTPESSSGSTWIVDEYDITSYTIFDIDQNGIPELIVCSDPDSSGFSGKIVYTIDPNTDEIVPVTYQGEDGEGCVIISYVSLAYASEYRAIVINRMKNSAMEGHKVLRAIDGVKWSDKDIGEIGYSTDLETHVHTYYSTLSGKRVEMTKEEFDAMFADGGMIQWFEWNEIE